MCAGGDDDDTALQKEWMEDVFLLKASSQPVGGSSEREWDHVQADTVFDVRESCRGWQ